MKILYSSGEFGKTRFSRKSPARSVTFASAVAIMPPITREISSTHDSRSSRSARYTVTSSATAGITAAAIKMGLS